MTEPMQIDDYLRQHHTATLVDVNQALDLEAGLSDITAASRQSQLLLDEVRPLLDLDAGLAGILPGETGPRDNPAGTGGVQQGSDIAPSLRDIKPLPTPAESVRQILNSINAAAHSISICQHHLEDPHTAGVRSDIGRCVHFLGTLIKRLHGRRISLRDALRLIDKTLMIMEGVAGETRRIRRGMRVLHELEAAKGLLLKVRADLPRVFDHADDSAEVPH